MRKRTRVRIKRILFLAKLAGGTIGFIYLLCRFETFRNLAGLFLTACVMTLIGEWMGAGPDETDTGILQDKAKWRCKSADNQ